MSDSGENVFWEDELHHLLVALVMLVQLAGFELSIPTMRRHCAQRTAVARAGQGPRMAERERLLVLS